MIAAPSSQTVSTPRLIPTDVGIGLCPEHHALVLDRRPAVPWFEVRAEPLMTRSNWLRDVESIARDYPLSLRAAGLPLGSGTRPEADDLRRLDELLTRLQPDFLSHGTDFLPGLHTEEGLASVVRNIIHVQDRLKRQILLENSAKSPRPPAAALAEECFLAEVVLRTGCGIVLNLNNLQPGAGQPGAGQLGAGQLGAGQLGAGQLGADGHSLLARFLEALEPQSIVAIHLSGRSGPVQDLFASAVAVIGPVPTLVEWHTQTPCFDALQAEAATLRTTLLHNSRQVDRYAVAAD